jgi:hypothetical protein
MTGRESNDESIVRALRAAAAEEARSDEAAHAEMLRASPHLARPPGEADRQRITDRLLGRTAVTPLRPRRARYLVPLGVAIPLAAGALLLFRPAVQAPLPPYDAELAGGIRETRGAEPAAGPQRLGPTSVLRVNLRPSVAVNGPVLVLGFIASSDQLQAVAVHQEVAPSGAVAVTVPAAEIFGARRGRWLLHLIVARPDLARQATKLARAPAPAGSGWQRITVPVELVD